MMNFGDGTTIHLLPEADGSIDQDDKQHLLDCYGGIAFSGAPVAAARTPQAGFTTNVGRVGFIR